MITKARDAHPQSGDWYEDKSNGERAKVIDVGKGRDLATEFRSFKMDLERANTKTVGAKFAFSGDSVGNADADCVLCERDWTENGYGTTFFIHFYTMQTTERFKPDHRLIGDN